MSGANYGPTMCKPRWMCAGGGGCGAKGNCVPTYSPCAPFKSACDCKLAGCGRQRYTCRCGPGNSTQIVPDPAGEYFSYEDAVRSGCGQQCTPSNFLGSYVGSEVYYPNCSSGSCSNRDGCCNVLKVRGGGGCGGRYSQSSCGGSSGAPYGMSISTGMNQYTGCNVGGEPLGPCVRGLDSNVLISGDPQVGCGGFEGILIDRPRDLLWANDLSGDPTVLTNTRYQSRDLRGDIAVGLVNTCCETGGRDGAHATDCKSGIVGPFCGTRLPSFGPFTAADPCKGAAVRTHIY
jgi:hypothetical protein